MDYQQDWYFTIISSIVGLCDCLGQERRVGGIGIEMNSFSVSFGSFFAKWSPLRMLAEPFHSECVQWELYRLLEALYREMDGIHVVFECERIPESICVLIAEFMWMHPLILQMAKEREFAFSLIRSEQMEPTAVLQRCAERFLRMPCFVIFIQSGPGSFESIEVKMRAFSEEHGESMRTFTVKIVYGAAQIDPEDNNVVFERVTRQFRE